MDVIVTSTDKGNTWNLKDLSGRSMGCIEKLFDERFNTRPAGQALETMAAAAHGHYHSLDAALAESPTRNSSGADFRAREPSHEEESKGQL